MRLFCLEKAEDSAFRPFFFFFFPLFKSFLHSLQQEPSGLKSSVQLNWGGCRVKVEAVTYPFSVPFCSHSAGVSTPLNF